MVDPSARERDDIVGVESERDDVLSVRKLHDLANRTLLELRIA